MDATITATGLTKRYGTTTAVDRLDLEVERGEVFGLLGPNGAGKTTTILMLLGLTEPTAGSVAVAGMDPTVRPLDVKRVVGYLPDNVGFYDGLTGRQNLRFTARLNGLERRVAESRIDRALDEVDLAGAGDNPAGTYSRGMKQRLGLADALIKDPTIMILDEPTMAIDPEGASEILGLIRSMADERGVTVLLSSHLLGQVQAVCDRVGIFVSGQMIARGRPADLAHWDGSVVFELGADAEPEALEQLVRAVPGVSEVERPTARSGGLWRISGRAETVRAVVHRATAEGIDVWHVRKLGSDLADIYHEYFQRVASHDSHA